MGFRQDAPETGIGVKKANVVEQVSKDVYKQRLQCLARSMKDIVWWAENFFRIITLDKGLTTIKLYPKQKELLQHIVDNNRTVVLSARQCGKCQFFDTMLSIRNKHTKTIENITVLNLFNIAQKQSYHQQQLTSEKFIATYELNDYQILSDTGWKNIVKVHKTIPYKIWTVTTASYELKCADEHIVFDQHMNQVFVKDLAIGNSIMTKTGLEKVLQLKQSEQSDNMYDVELDDDSNHRYYTNGILSHNTTTYTVFCLWLTTLFKDKKVLICANKLATASEVMARVRKAYEELPFWIKPGCISYSKTAIEFSNGSSVKAFSTSSSGARGASGNCVTGDTLVTVCDDFGNIFNCKIQDVEEIMAKQTIDNSTHMIYVDDE